MLLIAGSTFTAMLYRFGTRSCPLCQLRNSLPFSEREQTFEHLIMLGGSSVIALTHCIIVPALLY